MASNTRDHLLIGAMRMIARNSDGTTPALVQHAQQWLQKNSIHAELPGMAAEPGSGVQGILI